MSSTTSGESPAQRSLRWLIAAAAIALFVGLARLFNPVPSPAGQTPAPDEPPRIVVGGEAGRGLKTAEAAAEPIEVGELVGRDVTLRVFSTTDGVRYTVIDADGRELARLLEASEVYRRFPELDVRSMHLRGEGTPDMVDGPLMLAEPADPFE